MPVFIAALIGGLIQAAGTLVGRVLISLGIGYVVMSGLDTSLQFLKDQVTSSMGALGAQSMAVLSACKVGSGMSVIFSAFSARFALDGIQSGTVKKMVLK